MPGKSDKTIIEDNSVFTSIEIKKPVGNLKDIILELLGMQGPLTRDSIVELTGIPRTTLFDTLDKLILKGKIEKYTLKANRKGRPTVFYELVK